MLIKWYHESRCIHKNLSKVAFKMIFYVHLRNKLTIRWKNVECYFLHAIILLNSNYCNNIFKCHLCVQDKHLIKQSNISSQVVDDAGDVSRLVLLQGAKHGVHLPHRHQPLHGHHLHRLLIPARDLLIRQGELLIQVFIFVLNYIVPVP